MSSTPAARTVLPAQLAFLTIYNPAFGDSDETAYEQIFFHYSDDEAEKNRRTWSQTNDGTQDDASARSQEDQRNDQLRQVGLARGMVEFANNFSDGSSVDTIETEKSRIVLDELESGWWVLVSIDLTRLPSANKQKPIDSAVEYSSREVAPAPLLIAQLRRAHALFLLHHAANLNDLHSRLGRSAFSAVLDKYWTRFSRHWDVLLHGNPIVDVYNGTKLAGGGELGIGVGEEEWGSGEREVLEDFVRRTEGLKDLIVGRYGETAPSIDSADVTTHNSTPWLGTGDKPLATDGLVFSGIGALSRRSLASISQWMEAIFTDGENAYGVGDNPSSRPRARRKTRKFRGSRPQKPELQNPKTRTSRNKSSDLRKVTDEEGPVTPIIPPPLVGTVDRTLADATKKAEHNSKSEPPEQDSTSYFDADKMVSYLKLGYGSSWTLNPKGFATGQDTSSNQSKGPNSEASQAPVQQADVPETPQEPLSEVDPVPEVSDAEENTEQPFVQRLEQSIGRFLIGLPGDLENAEFEAEMNDAPGSEVATDAIRNTSRVFMRTITVELEGQLRSRRLSSSSPTRSQSTEPHDKLRVAVYVHRPFIFVFLFDLQTASLTMPSFYRSIHHQLGPLQKPLLRSTDPSRIHDRLMEVLGDKVNLLGSTGIYDLVYDPAKLTIRTSIPNIPLPGTLAAEGLLGVSSGSKSSSSRSASGAWYTLGIPIGAPSPPLVNPKTSSSYTDSYNTTLVKSDYTRIDALNIHSQLLHTYTSTRAGQGGDTEIERTVKTSRGWWVVWMRSPINPAALTREATPSASAATSPGPAILNQRDRERNEGSRPDVDGRGVEIEAILVRRGVDSTSAKHEKNRSGSSTRWLGLGGNEAGRSVSGASAATSSSAATSARGVVEGMGIDARKWVEGLVKLSA